MVEQRKRLRREVLYHAALAVDKMAFCAKVRNISEQSALLSTDALLKGRLTEGIRVCLIFSGQGPRSQVLWANVVRIFHLDHEKTGFAVQFEPDAHTLD
jgi:hypothetical protein